MKNDMPSSGGKHTLKNGDKQLPTHNARKHNMKAGSHDNPSGAVERGYTGGEKLGSMGSDNMKIRQPNPKSY